MGTECNNFNSFHDIPTEKYQKNHSWVEESFQKKDLLFSFSLDAL